MWVDSGKRNELIDQEVRRLVKNEAPDGGTPPLRSGNVGDAPLLDFVKAYVSAARVDFADIWNALFTRSRPDHRRPQDIAFRGVMTRSFEFDAYATIGSDQTRETIVSQGMFLAIEDVVTRLVCLRGFGSDDRHQERTLEAVPLLSETLVVDNDFQISPKIRYFDYSPFSRRQEGRDTALSCFYTMLPLHAERRALAQLILRISILWILLHEEAHHVLGHLRYYRHALGISGHSYAMTETTMRSKAGPREDASKVFEWQADREATRGVIEVVMRQGVLAELPSRYSSAPWLFRFTMVAIGCVIMLFDRARLIQKAMGNADPVGSHPTSRTRLLAASVHAKEISESHYLGGAELRLSPSDAHWAMHGAIGDIAIANRPGSREIWPLPADWRPDSGSILGRDSGDILHFRDWDDSASEPFGDVTLHTNADVHVGSLLMCAAPLVDPFGIPDQDTLLRNVHKIVLQLTPGLDYDAFVDIYRGWIGELSRIVEDHDSWAWDLLDGYRDDRWFG